MERLARLHEAEGRSGNGIPGAKGVEPICLSLPVFLHQHWISDFPSAMRNRHLSRRAVPGTEGGGSLDNRRTRWKPPVVPPAVTNPAQQPSRHRTFGICSSSRDTTIDRSSRAIIPLDHRIIGQHVAVASRASMPSPSNRRRRTLLGTGRRQLPPRSHVFNNRSTDRVSTLGGSGHSPPTSVSGLCARLRLGPRNTHWEGRTLSSIWHRTATETVVRRSRSEGFRGHLEGRFLVEDWLGRHSTSLGGMAGACILLFL